MLDQLFAKVSARLYDWLKKDYAVYFPVADGAEPVSKPLNFIDLYNGQPEMMKDKVENMTLPTNLPAIYIELASVVAETGHQGVQKAAVTMRLHVVQANLADQYVSKVATSNNQTKALRILEYLNQVNRTIHNWLPDGGFALSKFQRNAVYVDHDRVGVCSHVIEYTITVMDATTDPQFDWTTSEVSGFTVNGQIEE